MACFISNLAIHAVTADFMPAATPDLLLLAVNLTRRCNLACAHCYLDAKTLRQGDAEELGTADVQALLDDVARLGHGTMVVLTGGEPLIRKDLETLIEHGSALGLPMVVGTNAMSLTERRVRSLKKAGVLGLGISLDSLDPDCHDRFRGHKGAWAKTMKDKAFQKEYVKANNSGLVGMEGAQAQKYLRETVSVPADLQKYLLDYANAAKS